MPQDYINSTVFSHSKFAYFKYRRRENQASRCVLWE